MILAFSLYFNMAIVGVAGVYFSKHDFKEVSPEFENRLILHLHHPKVAKNDKIRIAIFLQQRRYFRCLRKFHWISICDQFFTLNIKDLF